jgi:hypothetical protein
VRGAEDSGEDSAHVENRKAVAELKLKTVIFTRILRVLGELGVHRGGRG